MGLGFRVEWVIQITVGIRIRFGRDFFRNPFLHAQFGVSGASSNTQKSQMDDALKLMGFAVKCCVVV